MIIIKRIVKKIMIKETIATMTARALAIAITIKYNDTDNDNDTSK